MSVNLGIKSILGIKRSTKRLEGPRPVMQTTKTLNGETFPDEGLGVEETRVLVIDPIPSYNIRYETTSTPQTVSLTNFGNSLLTVELPVLASSDGVDPLFTFNPIDDAAGEINIPAGTTATFQLAYYGKSLGTWSNALLFVTNSNVGNYKLITNQTVLNIYDFDILPPTYNQSIGVYARGYTTSFTIDPYQGITETISAVVSGSGYSIASVNTGTVVVEFDPAETGYTPTGVATTYTGIITVTANSIVHTATITTTIALDGDYNNYGAWSSPVSYYNSAVGISYDNIAGRRTLTIGVGTGGEGVDEYARGGAVFADITGLSIAGAELDTIYPYWANVYRIPLNASGDTTPRVYESKDHLVKQVNQDLEYGSYFGDYASQGSMFLVHDDGYGNIRVEMNRLRELSNDEDLNYTLRNLSRSFYYYSGVDVPSRYPDNNNGNFELLPFTPGGEYSVDGNLTRMFLGFLRTGQVVTSIVDKPIAD